MSRRTSIDSIKSTSSCSGSGNQFVRKWKSSNNCFSGEFNWEKYLQQSGMDPAPQNAFMQTTLSSKLTNKFELYQKLEAKDARNPSAISVATVVDIRGPRICLRLDGTDGCNDFWRLIDSKDIFPLGTCKAHGGLLQPPLGYTRNVSTWPTFLQRQLQKAKQALPDFFIKEPERPSENIFEIGQKLEAVDVKNPQLICPATIGDVSADQIFISFDGWRGAFDYWCPYDSRDVFPVGWCAANNHPLQPPGSKGEHPRTVENIKLVMDQKKRQTRSGGKMKHLKGKMTSLNTAMRVKPALRQQAFNKASKTTNTKHRPTPANLPVRGGKNTDQKMSRLERLQNRSMGAAKMNNGVQLSKSPVTPDTSCLETTSKESSADSDDSSSHKNDVSSDSNPIRAADEGHKLPTTDSVQQISEEDQRKLEKRARKLKKQQRRLAKALLRAKCRTDQKSETAATTTITSTQLALLASHKRPATDSDYFKPKRKKKKKKALESSSYTRMEGFGLKQESKLDQSSMNSIAGPTTSVSPTSPSFLATTTTPPSLFGSGKSGVVRSATHGWPTRLHTIGSVVTSDNKLGRFDLTATPTATVLENPPPDDIRVAAEVAEKSDTGVVTSPLSSLVSNKPEQSKTQLTCTVNTSNAESGGGDEKSSSSITTSQTSSTAAPSSPLLQNVTSTSQTPYTSDVKNDVTNNDVSSTTNLSPVDFHHASLAPTRPPSPPPPRGDASCTSRVTSTQQSVKSKRRSHPSRWSVTDVVEYVKEREPALVPHLPLFHKHEIDGPALLLLNSNNIVKYMLLKLGPTLKLCNVIEDLKRSLARHHHRKSRT